MHILICLLSAGISGIHTAAGLDFLNTINVRRSTDQLCQDLSYAEILKDIRVEKLNCAIACMISLLFPNDYGYKVISCLKVLLGFLAVLETKTTKGLIEPQVGWEEDDAWIFPLTATNMKLRLICLSVKIP